MGGLYRSIDVPIAVEEIQPYVRGKLEWKRCEDTSTLGQVYIQLPTALNRNVSIPSAALRSTILAWMGAISFSMNTCLAFSTSPNPPAFVGIMPSNCGGTR